MFLSETEIDIHSINYIQSSIPLLNPGQKGPGHKVPGNKVPKLVNIGHKVPGQKYNL